MASGQTLFVSQAPAGISPSGMVAATITTRGDWVVWAYDQSTVEGLDFVFIMPRCYSGNGVTIGLQWAGLGVTTGAVVWNVLWSNIANLDSNAFVSSHFVTTTTSATDGGLVTTNIFFSNSEIGGVVGGQPFKIRVQRIANSDNDTMLSDAQLVTIFGRET